MPGLPAAVLNRCACVLQLAARQQRLCGRFHSICRTTRDWRRGPGTMSLWTHLCVHASSPSADCCTADSQPATHTPTHTRSQADTHPDTQEDTQADTHAGSLPACLAGIVKPLAPYISIALGQAAAWGAQPMTKMVPIMTLVTTTVGENARGSSDPSDCRRPSQQVVGVEREQRARLWRWNLGARNAGSSWHGQ